MSLNSASANIKYIVDNQMINKIQTDLDSYVFSATSSDWTGLVLALSNLNILKSRIEEVISTIDQEMASGPVQVRPAP